MSIEIINKNRKNDGLKQITGRENALVLELAGFTRIATYKQWQKLGYQVKKGSKATTLKGANYQKDKSTGNYELKNYYRFNVFDVTQVKPIENKGSVTDE